MILYLRWPLHPNHICINYVVLRVNIRYSIGLRRLLRTNWLGARDPSSLLSVPVLSKRRKLCPVAQGYWNFLGVFILQTNHAWSRTSKLFLGLNKTTLGLVLASYSQPNRQAVTLKLTSFALWFPHPTPPEKPDNLAKLTVFCWSWCCLSYTCDTDWRTKSRTISVGTCWSTNSWRWSHFNIRLWKKTHLATFVTTLLK